MGALRTVALVILAISLFTFIALFGRLPAFRKTPVAFLHRVLWVYLPNSIAVVDNRLCGGRVMRCWNRSGSYILKENHPLVLIFFTSLMVIGEIVFVPAAWPRLSSLHRFWVPVAITFPYVLLYKCVVTKSFITDENHEEEMRRYPYDRVLFHPGHRCSTCDFLKPARSKHCSFCQACVSRHDHHCVWLMNCVGANNCVYFISLLVSLSVMLIYGSYLGKSLLSESLDQLAPPEVKIAMQGWTCFGRHLSKDWNGVPTDGDDCPLAISFLAYHTYLIWAGTTTNESSKWTDWKEDVEDGLVFKTKRSLIFENPLPMDSHDQTWPVHTDQILVTDEDPPTEGCLLMSNSNCIAHRPGSDVPPDPRWKRLRSMKDVDNIYDLGFWDNLRDVVGLSVRRPVSN
ncbi:Zinc finger DHHC-type palmitoyltransferase [Penicillium brevicompactum]|uniref:Palmitoyltransferase n=1 Tax=Penicillium brevicompactum TaxID=5074 RepID=A0A9W9UA73_PENBR|nr:Zinc finger DHHC-type palmitoyltransferase [Penicillium brevicompactum]